MSSNYLPGTSTVQSVLSTVPGTRYQVPGTVPVYSKFLFFFKFSFYHIIAYSIKLTHKKNRTTAIEINRPVGKTHPSTALDKLFRCGQKNGWNQVWN